LYREAETVKDSHRTNLVLVQEMVCYGQQLSTDCLRLIH